MRRFQHLLRVALLAAGLAGPAMAMAMPVVGTVSRVTDGDTVWVRRPGQRPVAVRLVGLDAPERCQAGGSEATAALKARLLRREVALESVGRDDYGRTLARLRVDGDDIGAWLVREGHAWSAGRGRDGGPYQREERSARRHRRGVFAADPSALENPRDFRRRHGPCPRPAARPATRHPGVAAHLLP